MAVDNPKGDPSLEAKGSQRAETDLHVRSYGERHMRSYADSRRHLRLPGRWPWADQIVEAFRRIMIIRAPT